MDETGFQGKKYVSDIANNRVLPNAARELNICKEGRFVVFITKAGKAEKKYEWQQEGLIEVLQQQKCGFPAGALLTKDT